jgi:hypothetical protein
MRAHVIGFGLVGDAPVLGSTLQRLVRDEGVRLFVVDSRPGGFVAGFGPLDLELTEESLRELVRHGADVERWAAS